MVALVQRPRGPQAYRYPNLPWPADVSYEQKRVWAEQFVSRSPEVYDIHGPDDLAEAVFSLIGPEHKAVEKKKPTFTLAEKFWMTVILITFVAVIFNISLGAIRYFQPISMVMTETATCYHYRDALACIKR